MISEETLRNNFSQRLIQYRKRAGMTQLELAERLNYSDKSISKWERAEGLPDLYVISQIAEVFEVTVNDMISEKCVRRKLFTRNKILTTLMAIGLPWLTATVLFCIFALSPINFPAWYFFIFAIPVTAIVAIVFTSIWWTKLLCFISVSALIWSLATVLVVTVNIHGIALIYSISAAVQILTILWYLRKKQ